MSFFEREYQILNRVNKNRRKHIRSGLQENTENIYILSKDELVHAITANAGGTIASRISTSNLVKLLVSDFGLDLAQYYSKSINNQTYFVFKGYAGLRKFLNTPIYKEQNFKMMELGLGQEGSKQLFRKSLKLNIIFSSAQTALTAIFSDKASFGFFFGSMITSLLKTGASALIASKVMIIIAGGTAVAAGGIASIGVSPVLLALAVGVIISFTLEAVDEKLGVTNLLVDGLDKGFEIALKEYDSLLTKASKPFGSLIKEIGCGIAPKYCGFF